MSGAFPPPVARPWGRATRPRCPCFPGAGGVGVGTQHQPHSVRSCEPALRSVGVAGWRPGERVPRAVGRGLRGQSLVPSPGCPPSGRGVRVRCPRAVRAGMRAWGPGTVRLAHMPCRGLRTAGVVGGRPGLVTSHRCEGRLVSGAVPLPAARPWGRAARPRCPCFSGAGGLGVGTQHRFHSVRSCELALRAVGVAGGRPRGHALCRCEGRLRSGARPPPAARPRGGQSWSAAGVLWARVCGLGNPALSLWCACPAGGRAPQGLAGGCPRVVTSHRCEGPLVSGAFPPPAARPWGRAARTRCPCLPGAGGVGVGTKHRPHSVRSWELALRALGVAGGRPWGGGGGVAPPRCEGAPGVRPSPSPGCPPVGRAARARRPGAVGAGVWVWVCRPYMGRAAGCGCAWCAWCLCGVWVFVWVRADAMCAVVPGCVPMAHMVYIPPSTLHIAFPRPTCGDMFSPEPLEPALHRSRP